MSIAAPCEPQPREPHPCHQCGGFGFADIHWVQRGGRLPPLCPNCGGLGFFGLEPWAPTRSKPGSDLRIAVYARRYASGIPIFCPADGSPNINLE